MKSQKLGPLHRRGNILYCFLPSQSGTGRGRELSLRTDELAEGKRRYEELVASHAAGELPNRHDRLTFEAALEKYFIHRRTRLKIGSFAAENSIAKALLSFFGPETKLAAIATIQRIRAYQDHRTGRKKLAPKTINNEVQVLRRLLDDANLWTGELKRLYRSLKVPASDIPNELLPREALALHQGAAVARRDEVAPFTAVLSFHTGLRKAEIRRLRLADISLDLVNPMIRVRRANTKIDAGSRLVVLDGSARWALRKLLERAKFLGAVEPEHYLIPKRCVVGAGEKQFERYDPTQPCNNWGNAWRTFKKKYQIEKRFHDLRHAYISAAARAGVPISVIQAAVGHMSPRMTQWHTHVVQNDLQDAAKRIEQSQLHLRAILDEGKAGDLAPVVNISIGA